MAEYEYIYNCYENVIYPYQDLPSGCLTVRHGKSPFIIAEAFISIRAMAQSHG